MAKRQFSSTKLYVLLRNLVIGISILSGLWAITLYYNLSNNKILNSYKIICGEIGLTEEGVSCMANAFKEIDRVENLFLIAIGLAIVLPLVFFGGVWVYKYLNPVKEI